MAEYLNIKELSLLTGYSVTQLRRLVRSGVLPFMQPAGKGGRLFFASDALERANTAQKVSAPVNRLSGKRPDWIRSGE